jgi:hypothetical protein
MNDQKLADAIARSPLNLAPNLRRSERKRAVMTTAILTVRSASRSI